MIPLLYCCLAQDAAGAEKKPVTPPVLQSPADPDLLRELLKVRRVYVDRMTGGETAAQMRELLIASLQNARLFILTENEERADAILRGAAEDLVFTDHHITSDGLSAHTNSSSSSSTGGGTSWSSSRSSNARSMGASISENESSNIQERKHEAVATVRLVNRDGDVIWSATQESLGGKFRGASADVAEKITRGLIADFERARKLK